MQLFVHFFLFYLIANGKDNLFFPQKSSSFSNPLSPFSKTQDLNERFLLAFYINNILIINDMRSKGFKAKFMMAFWGLFVEAHYIAANNDTMEGSQGILPFIILLIAVSYTHLRAHET